MKLKITHNTVYTFDDLVFLEPHYVRLMPKYADNLNLLQHTKTVFPKPTGHNVISDAENNVIDFYWFDGLTDRLTITCESFIVVSPYDPFSFLLYPSSFNELPFAYPKWELLLLHAALDVLPIQQDLRAFGEDALAEAHGQTIDYLSLITRSIHQMFTVDYREFGSPLTPDETFRLRSGSCRDLSWMLIGLLRHQGIAARFASGYYYFDMEEPAFELHAWVEVFLPGKGWLGLDPSHGLLTGAGHIAVASSANYERTMPISGLIRGSARSKLTTELFIAKI